MPQAHDILTTIAQFPECRTPQEVGTLLATAIMPFGLKFYAIGGMPTPSDPNPTSFMFHNWPDDWSRIYFAQDYASVDPVPRAAMTCAKPLTIGELRAGKAGFLPGPETADYFAAAQRLTGGKGLIVPICGPHGYHGIVVLVGEVEDFTPSQRVGDPCWHLTDRVFVLDHKALAPIQGLRATGEAVCLLLLMPM